MKIDLHQVPVETGSTYPDEFKERVAGRSRQRVGNAAGLKNFGVNLTTLQPGAQSALLHWHSAQDEFVYVVEGELVLVTEEGEQRLCAGEMAGFAAGKAIAHQLVNRSNAAATYLEIGDRTQPDSAEYPADDLLYKSSTSSEQRRFLHKDGRPYQE